MVTISERRWHSRWRILFNFVILSGLIRHCESMSIKRARDPGSLPSPPSQSRNPSEMKSQSLDSASDLAWPAWLFLDSQTGGHSSFDSGSPLRRITPKSVFIAPKFPSLPPCAEGYYADPMSRCVKGVNINSEAHHDFILEQLNNRYANKPQKSKIISLPSSSHKKSSDRFSLNIPLLSDVDSHSSKVDHEETKDSKKIPVVEPPQDTTKSNKENRPLTTSAIINQAKNHTRIDETLDFILNSNTTSSSSKGDKNTPTKLDMVIPVAEFVDDASGANYSDVVDYKIPIDLKVLLNASNTRASNISNEHDTWKNESQLTSSAEVSSSSIFRSSGIASLSTTTPDAESQQLDNNTDHYTVQVSNLMKNVTGKEVIGVDIPETTVKVLDVPVTVADKFEYNGTQNENSSEVRNSDVEDETESFYEQNEGDEDKDYDDGTDFSDEELAGAEGGEILKHGEAGMAIPIKNIERFQLEKRREQMERRNGMKKNESSRFDLLDDASDRFNDSTVVEKEDKEEAGSNVSSEVSITGDIILETTLLDVVLDKKQNNMKTPDTSPTSSIETDIEDLKELFEPEKKFNADTEVLLSPQNVYNTASTNVHESFQGEQTSIEVQSLEDPKSDELEAAPSSPETLLYNADSTNQYASKNPITKIHTIDDHMANGRDVISKKSKESNSLKAFESETVNFRPTIEYNRHPTSPRQPIKFPVEEVNSIHSQNYKEKVPYPLDDGLHSSTKSSIFTYQKSFHRGWRTSRQQAASKQMEPTVSNQRQRPLSISFWTSMPLIRDPSLYPTDQNPQVRTTNSQQYINRFPEVSHS